MNRVSRVFLALIELLAVIGIFAMMFHVSLNAFMRTLFSAPLFGTLELTSFWYLPLVAALGFIAAQLRREHIKADLVFEMMPRFAQIITFVVVTVACATVSALIFYYGLGEALHALSIGTTAGNTEYQTWFFQALTALAFLFLAVHYLTQVAVALRKGELPGEGKPDSGSTVQEAL